MGGNQKNVRAAAGYKAKEEAKDECRWPEGHFGSHEETVGGGQSCKKAGGVASPGESWPEKAEESGSVS